MMTRNARSPKRITFQVADVHKALLSITRAADAGYECHLNARGGYLLDTYTDGPDSQEKGNLYVMRAWVKEAQDESRTKPAAGFARQG